MFDAQRIENHAPVLVELKQCAKRSVLGWVWREGHDIVLGNPRKFLNGNVFARSRCVRGYREHIRILSVRLRMYTKRAVSLFRCSINQRESETKHQ